EPISPSVQTEGRVGTVRTVRLIEVALVKLPEVPVMVTVTVPVVAVLLAVSVNVLVLVVLLGLNDAVTPLGSPDADKLTVPLKLDRKSTRLNSSHGSISYAVFCLK